MPLEKLLTLGRCAVGQHLRHKYERIHLQYTRSVFHCNTNEEPFPHRQGHSMSGSYSLDRYAAVILPANESNTEYITGTITSVRNVAKSRPLMIVIPIGPQNWVLSVPS